MAKTSRGRGKSRVTLPGPWAKDLSRREFLAGLAAATGALATSGCGGDSNDLNFNPELEPLPGPESSGIEHIVVLMMENRSFDHFVGWLPGADGKQAGLEFVNKQGGTEATFGLAPNYQNCQWEDPDHSYRGGRTQFADGASDGWLVASTDDPFPVGYYVQDDLTFFGGAIPAWTTFDRYFCSILSSTFPNRFYMHASQTDRLSNTFDPSPLLTIWDRLAEKGLSGTYYYSDLPVSALWGSRLLPISQPIDRFFEDAAAGRLSNVTYVDPRFIGEEQGTSNDDHPLADIRNGQTFLNSVYDALTQSPNWENTVLVVNYDEWGGFYDHVPPPLAPQTELDPVIGNDGRLGFRVPCLLASPLARRGFVGRQQYDHTSILSMIEWRFGLAPLSIRDETANNMAHALDFSRPKNFDVPRFTVPDGPFGEVCMGGLAALRQEFSGLKELALRYGFEVR